MNSNLLPSLTYGCQTWKFTSKIKNLITTCQRALERSMLKIKKLDKIRHTKISEITKATNALNYAQKLKWKWAGHVARLKDQRWTKKVTFWKGPPGKKNRGRPLTHWEAVEAGCTEQGQMGTFGGGLYPIMGFLLNKYVYSSNIYI